jgi:hypothetical protein
MVTDDVLVFADIGDSINMLNMNISANTNGSVFDCEVVYITSADQRAAHDAAEALVSVGVDAANINYDIIADPTLLDIDPVCVGTNCTIFATLVSNRHRISCVWGVFFLNDFVVIYFLIFTMFVESYVC